VNLRGDASFINRADNWLLAIVIKPECLVWSTDTLEAPSVFAAIWRLE
jgi:hypothetical protein